jgi:carbon storage regulator
MLVLKRKAGESVMIGDGIEIQVLEITSDGIKLGFIAPKHVQIMRKELYESIREENLKAGQQDISEDALMNLFNGSQGHEAKGGGNDGSY